MYLHWQGHISTGDDLLDLDLRDITVTTLNGTTYLYSTTGANGGLAAFELSSAGTVATLVDTQLFTALDAQQSAGLAEVVTVGGQDHLIYGAGGGGLAGYSLSSATGRINSESYILPDAGAPVQLGALAVAEITGGLRLYTLDANTGALSVHTLPGNAAQGQSQTTAFVFDVNSKVDTVSIGADEFLLITDQASNSVISYSIDANSGALAEAGFAGAANGLGVNVPTVMETASAFGQTFVVLGAAGSSSISVMRLDSDGALTPTDHLIDNLTSRFDEVTTLTIAQDGDRVFVIAGGADDGLSLFTLTPSGQLVHLQSLAHFVGGGLQNVDRLQATIEGDALQLFVTSTASPGISQFYVDLGELGDVKPAGSGPTLLDGGAGDDMLVGSDQGRDTLSGGAGDDLLIAGAAGAYLTGGGGADLFVIHPDANETTISDFESGVDILDLSRFSMLYGIGQLAVQPFSWGARITFREATINVRSEDGSALDADDIFGQGFVGPDRVIVLAPDAGDLILGSAGSDTITGTENRDTIRALDGNDYIDARSGDDTVEGNLGNDTIFGGQGDDTIHAGDGHDEAWGGGGDDLLTGGAGNDLMGGSTGNDTIEAGDGNDEAWASGGRDLLRGGNGNDLMGGGTGDDTIYGEAGNDTLWGGRNNDEVHGDAGDDLIGGGPGNDRLWGGLGHDTFWANGGTDLIYGGAGDDLLGAGADNDVVWAEDGNDELRLGKGHDLGYGGAGNDTMRGAGGNDVLFGEDGGDLLFGENGNDQLVGGAGNDTLWGGTGADNFVFEEAQGDDVLRDFELGQDRISILSGASSFAALDMAQQGDDVVIWLSLGSVTLTDVQLTALGAGEFDFG